MTYWDESKVEDGPDDIEFPSEAGDTYGRNLYDKII
jgi:hypothetical protein